MFIAVALLCVFLALTNLPGVLDSNLGSIFGMAFCTGCAGYCLGTAHCMRLVRKLTFDERTPPA